VRLPLILLLSPLLPGQQPSSRLLRWGGYRRAKINHPFTDDDAKVLAGWGANVVRINFHQLNLMDKQPPYEINLEAVRILDEILNVCERNGLKAILDPHTTLSYAVSDHNESD
jgi:aryl-phospho-beta-D-glucosidase BglC (GH1 family)